MTDIFDTSISPGIGQRPLPRRTVKLSDAETAEMLAFLPEDAAESGKLGKDARSGAVLDRRDAGPEPEVKAASTLQLVEPPPRPAPERSSFRDQLAREAGDGSGGAAAASGAPAGSFREQMERENRRLAELLGTIAPKPVKETPPEAPPVQTPALSFWEQLAQERARDRSEPAPAVEAPPASFREQMERERRQHPVEVPAPRPPAAPAPPPPPVDKPKPTPVVAPPKPAPPAIVTPAPRPPETSVPGVPAAAAVALARAEADFLRNDPAAAARLIAGLRSDAGQAPLALGGVVKRPPDAPRDLPDADLLHAAFSAKVTPGNDKTGFAARYQRLHELLQDDPAGQDRLAKLLVTGALSNVGDAGEPLIDTLDRIADKNQGRLAARIRVDKGREDFSAMTEAFADPAKAVGALLEKLTPAPEDGSPRAMLARTGPGQYAQLVADLALSGNAVISRQLTFGNDYFAADVIAEARAKEPPADLLDYATDLAWLHDDEKLAGNPRYQAVLHALDGHPEAQTALALLAKEGKFSDKGYYAPGGSFSEWNQKLTPQRASPLEALAKLADPATPLAEGIDRDDLLAEVVKGLATPFPTIAQGEWQTCTVATIQRLYAEHRPEEYIRAITGLASPEGKVRLAEGKGSEISRPADWNDSVGDGRSTVNRLFQSALIGGAVRDYNKRIFDKAGFPATAAESATYSNADDTWVDPYGNLRRGLPPDAVSALASQLDGKEYATIAIPPALAGLVTPDVIAKAVLAMPDRQTSSGISNVPMTLELTVDGKKILHEVLLGNMTKGPPPMATLIDPSDGRTRQMEVATLAKSIKSLAFSKDDFEMIMTRLSTGKLGGYLDGMLEKLGDKGSAILAVALPLLLPSMIKADVGDKTFKPAVPPAGAPEPEQLAPILAEIEGERPPVGRFALHDLVQAGALDQRTGAGRQLLADLQGIASGEVELPEGMSRYDALTMALLDTADDVADSAGDAGGSRGRRFVEDAGGGRGRRFIEDAGGARGRRYLEDAGGGRGRRYIEDAGGGRGRRYLEDAGGGRGRRYIEDAGGGRGRRYLEDAGGGRGRRFVEDAGGGGLGDAAEYLG